MTFFLVAFVSKDCAVDLCEVSVCDFQQHAESILQFTPVIYSFVIGFCNKSHGIVI